MEGTTVVCRLQLQSVRQGGTKKPHGHIGIEIVFDTVILLCGDIVSYYLRYLTKALTVIGRD